MKRCCTFVQHLFLIEKSINIANWFTKQPVSVTVANGETAITTVEATGDSLIYTWYYAKKTIP